MKYSIENLKGQTKIDFEVATSEWEADINKSYQKNKYKYNIPGFRKGHATRKMIESMYGPVFFDDAFHDCFNRSYSEALDANPDIYPVDRPDVDVDNLDENSIKFHAVVTVRPEVKLGSYTGINLPLIEYTVSQDEVDAEINNALERASKLVSVEREIKDGDIIKLDYSGSVDGVKFPGGTALNQELNIGSKTFIPGFEEQLIGLKLDEVKDIEVTFPEEYHAKELAGKKAVFNVKINEIKVKEKPAADDAFAKENSKFETFGEYKADVEKNIADRKERQAKNENENALIKAVADNAEVDIPQCMIDSQLDYMLKDFEYQLMYMYQGMKLDDYFKYTGTTAEDYKKSRENDAKEQVKSRLVIEDIIKAEKIEVLDADLDLKMEEVAKNANKTLDEYKKGVSDRQLEYMKNDVLMEKFIKFLKDGNTFTKGDAAKPAAKPKSTASKPKAAAAKTDNQDKE